MPGKTMLISGARAYDHNGDTGQPPVRDILIEDGRIVGLPVPGEDADLKAAMCAGCW